ncbi:class I SAM-dependent methyltransferase [Meiothermus sp. QL-1]|uniref:class I SAM-dependent methyltransferase n=1 Tax=Meiothermus sp. QL-1 TaxID=2058095 RepID=UPI000E0B4F5F|nr:class I SAM-dependent methyltransferase [Meiothermus sp. QL-1]RDI96388.1 class I SAM-dependent methyltransferase [Meiothermus sp. QL-1]
MASHFSRVAFTYDRTRYHPPEVSGRIATAITAPVEKFFRDPLFLELGAGTGRIAVPIIARGYRYIALDNNPAMLEVLRQKVAGVARKARLVEADACELPFERHSLHAVIAVHFWHLLDCWQEALRESLRVLRPGGFLFEGWDQGDGESEDWRIQQKWQEILARMGYRLVRGRHQARLAEVERELLRRQLEPRTRVVAEWVEMRSPRTSLEMLSERIYSFTWAVPEEVFRPSIAELLAWASDVYSNLDAEYPVRWKFLVRTTRL